MRQPPNIVPNAIVLALAGAELGVEFLEGVRNVFEEDQAQHHMLVLGGVHMAAQLVGGAPEHFFNPGCRGGARCFGHE